MTLRYPSQQKRLNPNIVLSPLARRTIVGNGQLPMERTAPIAISKQKFTSQQQNTLRQDLPAVNIKQRTLPAKLIDKPVLKNKRKSGNGGENLFIPLSPNQLSRRVSHIKDLIPELENGTFKYDVVSGNNGALVSTLLNARGNWRQV